MHVLTTLIESHELAAIISIAFLVVIVIPALWFIARELIGIGRLLRATVSRDELNQYQQQLTRLEHQITEWLAHDHVRRSEFTDLVEKVTVSGNRLVRIETWEDRLRRLELRINGMPPHQ